MKKFKNKLKESTTSQPVLKYAGLAAVAVIGIGSMAALTVINADTSAGNTQAGFTANCGYGDSSVVASIGSQKFSDSTQVSLPAPSGDGWLSIDSHEVTNAQFERFVKATGYKTVAEKPWSGIDPATGTKLSSPPGSAVFIQPKGVADAAFSQWWAFIDGANWRHPTGTDSDLVSKQHYPVVQLTLADAEAYAEWAGRRLLTATEWEHAARYNEDNTRQVWHRDESIPTGDSAHWLANTWQGIFPLRDNAGDGFEGIAPVGCYEPLASGLYDMIGNVWEWVQPQGDEQVARRLPVIAASVNDQTPAELSNRAASATPEDMVAGAPNGNFHGEVNSPTSSRIMGGSYLCSASFCMNYHPGAYYYQDATLGTNHIGFRTVADIPAPNES